jgi:small-conductance mechanosensitive channel
MKPTVFSSVFGYIPRHVARPHTKPAIGLRAFRNTLSFAPPWAVSFVLLVSAVIVAWLLYAAILVVLRRMLRGRRPYLLSILDATKNPARLGVLLLALAIALPTTPLGPETRTGLTQCLLLATIFLLGWIATTALEIAATIYLLRFRLDVDDNLLARKHVTQIRVLMRVLNTIIFLITGGFALMTFDAVRQYGVSLFASAGVAGIVAGLAARPVLSNLFAGVQLAMAQPIRIEDAVTVENEYGWVEEITSTYVVIRLWDLRRLIVPLTYFIEKPFYNWTRHAANYIGNVLLYLDYGAPVDRIRQKAIELVAQSKLASGKVTSVQVTNTRPDSIEVRILISADSAANASNLCAELREELIAFLQREHPEALPRQRSESIAAPRKDSPPTAPNSHGD